MNSAVDSYTWAQHAALWSKRFQGRTAGKIVMLSRDYLGCWNSHTYERFSMASRTKRSVSRGYYAESHRTHIKTLSRGSVWFVGQHPTQTEPRFEELFVSIEAGFVMHEIAQDANLRRGLIVAARLLREEFPQALLHLRSTADPDVEKQGVVLEVAVDRLLVPDALERLDDVAEHWNAQWSPGTDVLFMLKY